MVFVFSTIGDIDAQTNNVNYYSYGVQCLKTCVCCFWVWSKVFKWDLVSCAYSISSSQLVHCQVITYLWVPSNDLTSPALNDLTSQEQGFLPWKSTNKQIHEHWVADCSSKCSCTHDCSCSCSSASLVKVQLFSYTCCSVEGSTVGLAFRRASRRGIVQEVSLWEKGYEEDRLRTQTDCRAVCRVCTVPWQVSAVRYGWHSTFGLRHSVAPCLLLTDLRKADYFTCTPLLNLNHIGSAHLPFCLQEEPI